MRELLARYPDARHYIVGHSHGGTVAMMALIDPALADRISGVACLSTPFLHVRRRPVSFNYLSIGVLFSLLFVTWWERTLGGYFRTALPGLYGSPYGHAALIIACAALVGPALVLLLWTWYRRAETVRARSALPPLPADRVLLLRADSDEASGVLAGMALIGSAPGRLWSWGGLIATRLVDRHSLHRPFRGRELRRIVARLALGAVALAAVGLAVGMQLIDRTWLSALTSFISAASTIAAIEAVYPLALIAGYALHAVLGFVAAFLTLWWTFFFFGFGWEIATVGLFLDPSAEATPPGAWELHHFSSPEPGLGLDLSSKVVLLKHSEIYNNPAAVQRVVDWIGSR